MIKTKNERHGGLGGRVLQPQPGYPFRLALDIGEKRACLPEPIEHPRRHLLPVFLSASGRFGAAPFPLCPDSRLRRRMKRGGRPGGTRTPNRRIWSPVLYQLSHWPSRGTSPLATSPGYSITSVTTPAPTVRPPSRIANRSSFSIAIGMISSTLIPTLSPGITISRPSGSATLPVTSVVRK